MDQKIYASTSAGRQGDVFIMTNYTDFKRFRVGLDEISLKGYQVYKENGSQKNLEISFGKFDMVYFIKSIKINL
jgi:hypothetical protein